MEDVARELIAPRAQPPAPMTWERLRQHTHHLEDASEVYAVGQPLASSR
jgi:hypothetical protein